MFESFKKRILSSTKVDQINLNKLKKILGGQENINNVTFTHSKVKIFLKTTQNLNLDAIKKIKGITGIFVASNYITIIVGKQSEKISKLLLKK